MSAAALSHDSPVTDLYHQIVDAAAEYFATRLHTSVEAQACRDYLASRDYHTADAETFGLGFSDASTIAQLRDDGFTDEQLISAGLVIARDGRAPFPRFRNRLMFPIHDTSGRVAGFSGRAIDDAEPKYLNSPASPHFSKGELLYHLDRAASAIEKLDRVLIVEGNFDVMRVALAGFAEVVAPLGTAMTEVQASTLAESARVIYLLYDGDAAGARATVRSALLLLAAGTHVRVGSFLVGEDPDSTIATHGIAAFAATLEEATDIFDWQITRLTADGMFADSGRKRQSIDLLVPTIGATKDPILRDLYIGRLAAAVGISRSTIEAVVPPPGQTTKRKRFRAITSEIIAPPAPDITPAKARPTPPWQHTPRSASL